MESFPLLTQFSSYEVTFGTIIFVSRGPHCFPRNQWNKQLSSNLALIMAQQWGWPLTLLVNNALWSGAEVLIISLESGATTPVGPPEVLLSLNFVFALIAVPMSDSALPALSCTLTLLPSLSLLSCMLPLWPERAKEVNPGSETWWTRPPPLRSYFHHPLDVTCS